jgi:hypothetical protein
MTTTNKRLLISESRGDLNRCTPCREKPDQRDTYASHTSPRTLPTVSPRTWQPFMSRQQSWTESLLLRKKAPNTIDSTPADRSVGPYLVSLPSQPMKQWRKPHIYQQQATRLTGHISSAYDWYVQYVLMGGNRTVINRHMWGLRP